MNVGDLVIYTEGERDFNALVLGSRQFTDHDGADGQPTLTLAFAKERVDAFGNSLPIHGTGQTTDLVQFRLDVAHQSHTYSEEQQAKYGKSAYDGGRWREKE